MPYTVIDNADGCSGYAVVKIGSTTPIPGGCHDTKQEALAHLAAVEIATEYERNVDGPDAMIVDIDDTLVRLNGEPIQDVIDYVNSEDYRLFVITGRVENERQTTQTELNDIGLRSHTLYMKPNRDIETVDFKRRQATELLVEYNIEEAIDNDPTMRAMYEQLGIKAQDPMDLPMEDSPIENNFNAPKDSLVRHVTFRAEPSNDGLTLEGYAAVFNEWTAIDSWEGSFRERIAPGAFKKTLTERTPILQFDHGTHPLIGSLPLGVFTSIREDEHGLRVKARLSDNWLVQPVRDAIRDGAITGMSFRFRVINDNWKKGTDRVAERTINEVALFEAGPVVFPAYEQTTVGVRSREVLTALSDPEVRVELARCLLTGTGDEPAATELPELDEPVISHSPRTIAQRRALALLTLQRTNK